MSPELMRGLDKMGFTSPTPVQEASIAPMLEGHDLLVQAPTGTGKTCAFGIPVIEAAEPGSRKIGTVILCPTRELAIQTAGVLQKLTAYRPGVRVQALYGGEHISRQITALRRKPQVIVATPGRLMDHIQRRTVRLDQVQQIVLDEADRMLDMGFRDDIDTILQSVPDERQTVLFSATISDDIKRIAAKYQQDVQQIHIRGTALAVDTVEQFYSQVQPNNKTAMLVSLLEQHNFRQTLVFVATKSMADKLAAQLNQQGLRADSIHGDLRQRQRDAVMDKYRRGRTRILVATDVAARGIDVNGIDAVINYDIPLDYDSYVHRIGRTGRAQKTGVAYTLLYSKERATLRNIIRQTGADIKPLTPSDSIPLTAERTEFPQRKKQPKRPFHAKRPYRGKSHGNKVKAEAAPVSA